MDELPDIVSNLESDCSQFTVLFSGYLPESLRILAFCSPASFRDPETDDIWHPFFYSRGRGVNFFLLLKEICKAIISGCYKFAYGKFGSTKLIVRTGANKLAIGPELVCPIISGKVETEYLCARDRDEVHWLVVSSSGSEEGLSRFASLSLIGKILVAWGRASIHGSYDRNRLIASVLVFRWILSMSWAAHWIWLQAVKRAITSTQPDAVFCTHEAHPLSRLVWHASEKLGTHAIAVQHAIISRTKLWYFSTEEERKAGLCFPDNYAVFCESTRKLLRPYVSPRTEIELACGPRFIKWKSRIGELVCPIGTNKKVLFVPSLAWWDNMTVLLAVDRLLTTNLESFKTNLQSFSIQIRLHPNGVVPSEFRRKLKAWLRFDRVALSQHDVLRDLEESTTIVGATSSVLAEATLLGVNAISLSNRKFLYTPAKVDMTVWWFV